MNLLLSTVSNLALCRANDKRSDPRAPESRTAQPSIPIIEMTEIQTNRKRYLLVKLVLVGGQRLEMSDMAKQVLNDEFTSKFKRETSIVWLYSMYFCMYGHSNLSPGICGLCWHCRKMWWRDCKLTPPCSSFSFSSSIDAPRALRRTGYCEFITYLPSCAIVHDD